MAEENLTENPVPKSVEMINGLPCFIADVDDVLDYARAQGLFRFYVLAGSVEFDTTDTTKTGTVVTRHHDSSPTLFEVVINAIGYVVRVVPKSDGLALRQRAAGAWFELPKIPWEMIQKLDQFFRAAYDKHGTEAIVLLTFDPRTDSPDGSHNREGWGVLVPKQTNSAAHCHYDPQSIIDDKDDEVIIVGTAHSHPCMDAFASHTDHADQMGNDGIHITYGWSRGSGYTDLHIELQMMGSAYEVTDHAIVLEAAPKLPPAPEVEAWTERVTKSTPAISSNTQFPARGGSWYSGGHGSSAPRSSSLPARDPNKHYTFDNIAYDLPAGAPDPDDPNNAVILRLLQFANGQIEPKCPMCGQLFHDDDVERRRCWSCYCFLLVGADEKIDDVILIRQKSDDTPIIDLVEGATDRGLLLWDRYFGANNAVETNVVPIFSGKALAL